MKVAPWKFASSEKVVEEKSTLPLNFAPEKSVLARVRPFSLSSSLMTESFALMAQSFLTRASISDAVTVCPPRSLHSALVLWA